MRSGAHPPTPPRFRLNILAGAIILGLSLSATATDAQPPSITSSYAVQAPQRLSNWLHEHKLELLDTESLATGWSTPEELRRQQHQRQFDVTWLGRRLWQPMDSPVWRWLANTPATGRLPVSAAVAPWLEGVPVRDPLLRVGDQIWTSPTHQPVRVIDGKGRGCKLPHRAGAYPQDYLRACALPSEGKVWLVQPDGRITQHALDAWQPEPLPQLAPGATIWLGWPRELFWLPVNESELQDINLFTARWLANARPGEAPEPTPAAETGTAAAPVSVASSAGLDDWTGLQGARFAPQPSASNWGVMGLMQTPTARMRSAGNFGISVMNTSPNTWVNVMLQPLDWLEGGFRYVSVSNRLYGPAEFSGSQSYKDKSFELKARLWPEGQWHPAVAVGIRDLGGTGLFGGEYAVASKRWGRLDASLGLGWGYVGNRAIWRNPLSVFGSAMDSRVNETGRGGTLSTQSYFRGRVAPFGGLEYQSPWRTTFKLEYNGNDYRNEPQGNNQTVRSPLNFGLVYHWAPGMDLHASWERGTTLGLGITVWTDLSGLSMPS